MQQQGLDSTEAHRRAAVAFGGVEKYRGAGRDVLGLSWARGMSTDIKLGTRMLRKYPGLTAVALFALSLAIGAGERRFRCGARLAPAAPALRGSCLPRPWCCLRSRR